MPLSNLRRAVGFIVPALLVSVSFGAGAQDIFVSSFGNNQIHEYSSTGADLGVFATSANPIAMAFNGAGDLLVTDFYDSQINEFSPTGSSLGVFASTGMASPDGLVITSSGNVLVSNRSGSIEEYSSTGADLGAFGTTGVNPSDLAIDSSGNVYSASIHDNTITKLSPTGVNEGIFASAGLTSPSGLAFDSSGNLYAANNTGDGAISEYSPSGSYLGAFVTTTFDPYSLAFTPSGDLLVANQGGNSVEEYSSTGTDLGVFLSAGLNNPVEFAFTGGESPTPEPGTIGLAIGGFITAGSVLIRRRRVRRSASVSK